MSVNQQSSLFVKIGGFIWFSLMSVGAFIYFWFSIVSTFKDARLSSSLVVFERGAYYLPGVGIALMALVIIGLYENYTKKPPSDKVTKIFTRTAIGGLLFTFLLPPIAEYLTENHLLKKGYQHCDVPTSSWPVYKDVIYTTDTKTCLKLIDAEKKKFPSLYPKVDKPVFQHY